ncbi:MAG: Rpn family recombination-promoting nuclease/putative transposase [Lachnospiraceae bacterium]|nr:Rpn family recombination-promoting nuclease/putative transposase [Lachnospiraceae bacterium]
MAKPNKNKKQLSAGAVSCYTKREQKSNECRLSEYEKFWQNLTITGDFIFGKIMLDRGQAYDELSTSYVVFICSIDLFHRGYHIYEFRNYCTQDRELELGDDATKIFLNARGKKEDISPPLKEFLDYVAGKANEKPSEFIAKLEGALHHAKQNREWRRQRMIQYFKEQDIKAEALQQGREEGRKLGREEGRLAGRTEMILSMIAKGYEREAVKEVASITDEELDAILAKDHSL